MNSHEDEINWLKQAINLQMEQLNEIKSSNSELMDENCSLRSELQRRQAAIIEQIEETHE